MSLAGIDVEGISVAGQVLLATRHTSFPVRLALNHDSACVAVQETCIMLPQHKLVLDTGRCPQVRLVPCLRAHVAELDGSGSSLGAHMPSQHVQRAVYYRTVLLSHCHLDHVGGLPFIVSTRCSAASRAVLGRACLWGIPCGWPAYGRKASAQAQAFSGSGASGGAAQCMVHEAAAAAALRGAHPDRGAAVRAGACWACRRRR